MNWSNAEYDKLTLEQYREMDSAKRMELLKQAQGVMYTEQPMIVIDYPSVLQAVNTSRWEGWQPYVGGSVWANMIDRQSYIELKPKAAAAGAAARIVVDEDWVAIGVVPVVGSAVVVWLGRRGRRARGPGMSAPVTPPGDYHVHTEWSDGLGTVEEVVRRAAELGLPEIAVTEHFTPSPGADEDWWLRPEELGAYVADVPGRGRTARRTSGCCSARGGVRGGARG